MPQNTKVTKWAKENQEALYMLYEDGVLSEEQLRTLVNLNGDYDVSKQDAIFDNVKQTIQSKLTEDRLNRAVKNKQMSAGDAKRYGSLSKSVAKFEEPTDALLSSKLSEQIRSSGYGDLPLLKGMREQIKNLSDDDTREYIYNQRAYLNQMLPDRVIKAIPDLQEYMAVQPSYGVKKTDYAKMFNDSDVLDKLGEYSFRDIDYIARKNGMTGRELLKDMTDAKTAKDREAIAHGRWDSEATIPQNIANEVGGTLLSLFGRRQQEAIARGEDPRLRDYAGDVAEQLAYMAPVGRIAGPVAKVASKISPRAAKVASTTARLSSNAIVPTASETYDAALYEDDLPRGNFSLADVLTGTTVNTVAPYALRRVGSGVGRVTGSKDIQQSWGELAEGKTKEEILKEIQTKYKGFNIKDADNPNVSSEVRRKAQEYKSLLAADPELEQTLASRRPVIFEIAKESGNTLEEKAKNYVSRNYPDGYTIVDVNSEANAPTVAELYKLISDSKGNIQGNPELTIAGKMGKFMPEKLSEYEANPNVTSSRLMSVYDKLGLDAIESAKTQKELIEEDLLKNYLTNQAGNFVYANKAVTVPGLSLLPIDINQILREYSEKTERQKAIEKSKKRLPDLKSVYGD